MSAANSTSETLATRELSNMHVISCHVMWIMCLLVSSFWEGSSSLMEARDGSLESVSKTLSIWPHLILECTVPLTSVHKPTQPTRFLLSPPSHTCLTDRTTLSCMDMVNFDHIPRVSNKNIWSWLQWWTRTRGRRYRWCSFTRISLL